MRIRHSWIDGHLKYFRLFFNSLAFAAFALIFFFIYLSTSFAAVAASLRLSHESRSQLNHLYSYSHSIASIALHWVVSSFAIAVTTDPIPGHSDIFHRARVDLFQSDLYYNQLWLHFFRTVIPFLVEDVEDIACTRRSSILNSLLSILIIELPLFWVSEGVTGLFDSVKPGRVSAAVGVLFECFLSECFFDLLGGSILGYFQEFVELCGIDFFVEVLLRVRCVLLVLVSPEKHVNKSLIYLAILDIRCSMVFIIDALEKNSP